MSSGITGIHPGVNRKGKSKLAKWIFESKKQDRKISPLLKPSELRLEHPAFIIVIELGGSSSGPRPRLKLNDIQGRHTSLP
jgi:hypothetical protein